MVLDQVDVCRWRTAVSRTSSRRQLWWRHAWPWPWWLWLRHGKPLRHRHAHPAEASARTACPCYCRRIPSCSSRVRTRPSHSRSGGQRGVFEFFAKRLKMDDTRATSVRSTSRPTKSEEVKRVNALQNKHDGGSQTLAPASSVRTKKPKCSPRPKCERWENLCRRAKRGERRAKFRPCRTAAPTVA